MDVGQKFRMHCRDCERDTNSEVVAAHKSHWESECGNVHATIYYYILKCLGCDTVHFLEEMYFSEDYDDRPRFTYWPPKSSRPRPKWLPDFEWEDPPLASLLGELYSCLDTDAHVAATICVRTIFERIAVTCGVDEKLQFARKLDQLAVKGSISGSERDSLEILIEAGSAAAHRGWKPSIKDLNTVVHILENFAERILIIEKKAAKIRPSIPKKK